MKVCLNCGIELIKSPTESKFNWKNKKFCSKRLCITEYNKKHKIGWFFKGNYERNK